MTEEFRQRFREEAAEFLAQLEDMLLAMEKGGADANTVNEIFRLMHSLKGSGAMFGFDRISNFTHHLESLYQQIREGKLEVSERIVHLSLQSVDHLQALLNKQKDGEKDETAIVAEIQELMENGNSDADLSISNISGQKTEQKAAEEIQNCWFIDFQPKPNLLENGTSPLYLIDELDGMGSLTVFADTEGIPIFSQIDPTKCYLAWRMILQTAADENEIRDVFIFVEDDCKLDIRKIEQANIPKEKEAIIALLQNKADFSEEVTGTAQKEDQPDCKNEPAPQSEQVEDPQIAGVFGQNISTIRVSSQKLDHLMNIVSEMVSVQARLANAAEIRQDSEFIALAEGIQKLTRRLRENAFDICLVPFNTLLTRFKRLVRDLSVSLQKEVSLITEGTDTELDKNIIQELADPIMHIIRNSIDHGIENADDRIAAGKPVAGQILLKSWYSGTYVYISVSDDGRGLDAAAIRKKAEEKGIIDPAQQLSEKEIFQLICQPGFSTAQNISDVSGRGVGMDVVMRRLEALRGTLDIQSETGKGSVFTLRLPLSLSILDGLLVKAADSDIILPISIIDQVFQANEAQFSDFADGLLVVDGKQLPYVDLTELFDKSGSEAKDDEYIITIRHEERLLAIKVNHVVGEHQAVVKPLGKYLRKHEIFSGASILGDGSVALVVDMDSIVKKYINKEE